VSRRETELERRRYERETEMLKEESFEEGYGEDGHNSSDSELAKVAFRSSNESLLRPGSPPKNAGALVMAEMRACCVGKDILRRYKV